MRTERHCPGCGKQAICMRGLANDNQAACIVCNATVAVNRLWECAVYGPCILVTYALFYIGFLLPGIPFLMVLIPMLAGIRLWSVRWMPLRVANKHSKHPYK